jgi:hypothetical protein
MLISFKYATLDINQLQNLLTSLNDRPLKNTSRIIFDFSKVEEFQGPWCSHFAAIALLAEKYRDKIDIHITGLKGQPLAIATAFNQSSVIKGLLDN